MAVVTDPLLADHTGIDGADGLAAASRLQVGVFTRQCAGMRVLPAAAKQARRAGDGLVLTAPGALVLRMLDRTGSMTGLLVDLTVEEAAGVASPQRAARPVRNRTRGLSWPGCPLSGQDASRKKGSVGPHQQPTSADGRPHGP